MWPRLTRMKEELPDRERSRTLYRWCNGPFPSFFSMVEQPSYRFFLSQDFTLSISLFRLYPWFSLPRYFCALEMVSIGMKHTIVYRLDELFSWTASDTREKGLRVIRVEERIEGFVAYLWSVCCNVTHQWLQPFRSS